MSEEKTPEQIKENFDALQTPAAITALANVVEQIKDQIDARSSSQSDDSPQQIFEYVDNSTEKTTDMIRLQTDRQLEQQAELMPSVNERLEDRRINEDRAETEEEENEHLGIIADEAKKQSKMMEEEDEGVLGGFMDSFLAGASGGIAASMMGFFKSALKIIGKAPLIAFGISFASGLIDSIKEYLDTGEIIGALLEFANSFTDSLIKIFTFGFFDLQDVLESEWLAATTDFIMGTINQFKDWWLGTWDTVISTLTFGTVGLEDVQEKFGQFFDFGIKVGNWWLDGMTWLWDAWKNGINYVVGLPDRIATAVSDLVTAIQEALDPANLAKKFPVIGRFFDSAEEKEVQEKEQFIRRGEARVETLREELESGERRGGPMGIGRRDLSDEEKQAIQEEIEQRESRIVQAREELQRIESGEPLEGETEPRIMTRGSHPESIMVDNESGSVREIGSNNIIPVSREETEQKAETFSDLNVQYDLSRERQRTEERKQTRQQMNAMMVQNNQSNQSAFVRVNRDPRKDDYVNGAMNRERDFDD